MAYVAGIWQDMNLLCPLAVYLFIVECKQNEDLKSAWNQNWPYFLYVLGLQIILNAIREFMYSKKNVYSF